MFNIVDNAALAVMNTLVFVGLPLAAAGVLIGAL
jgi:hypothetical protein